MIQYLSNKAWVPDTIEKVLGHKYKTVDDAFCGSCLVSHGLKLRGYEVRCNDYFYPAFCMAEGLIVPNATANLEDRLRKMRNELSALKAIRNGPLYVNCHCAAEYLTETGANFLDAARLYLENVHKGGDLYYPGLVMIMMAADRMWRTMGHMTTYGLTPHKNIDRPEYLVPPILKGNGRATHADVFDCNFDSEILYLDPPYGGVKYPMYFHCWYSLCNWKQHDTMHTNHIPVDCTSMQSTFDNENNTLPAVKKIIRNSKCKVAIVSMNLRNGAEQFTKELEEFGRVSFVENSTKRTNFQARERPIGSTVERLIFVRRE
jgi:adenine-specific DNA methylase